MKRTAWPVVSFMDKRVYKVMDGHPLAIIAAWINQCIATGIYSHEFQLSD